MWSDSSCRADGDKSGHYAAFFYGDLDCYLSHYECNDNCRNRKTDESKKKWFIIYSSEEMYAEYYYIMRLPNTIYFATKEKAEEAIEVFKDELLWYFTEYVQRLDEMQND